MIANLDYQTGEAFSGIFRMHCPEVKTARNNARYLSCVLQDRSGDLPAYAWSECFTEGSGYTELDRVQVQGRLRMLGGRWIADLESAEVSKGEQAVPLALVPGAACPLPTGLERLERVLDGLHNAPLKRMLLLVLNNDTLLLPFLVLPASRRNHHAYSGGLLDHSLECAEFVANYHQYTADILELGIVAALLHDIGKVRTLGPEGKGTMLGRVLGHDHLTLELLSEPLALLDREWRDGGIALRYLLSWKLQPRASAKPLMVMSELVQAADRISTGADNERELFRDMPNWRQYVHDENGRSAWRPRLTRKVI